jgi:carbon-monoxide dehydrogenase medium subunit
VTIVHEFEYARPETLGDALDLLSAHGAGAQLLAGGTDLIAWLRDDLAEPEILIDLKGISGLGEITVSDDTLRIGALATFSDVIASDVVRRTLPVLAEMALTVASVGIRNRATLVGNLCAAVPSNDAGPILLAAGASVEAAGSGGTRTISLREWFSGPRETTLGVDEIVTAVSVPVAAGSGAVFCKLARYAGEDLAQASVAVIALPGRSYRIAFGAVAPATRRAESIEDLLEGREIDAAAVQEAVALVPEVIAPITDIRSTAEYRAHMCRVMLARSLPAAAARRDGAGPPFGETLI